jgi:predicted MFS family arabinose efflux permease
MPTRPPSTVSPTAAPDTPARRLRPLRLAQLLQGVAFWVPVEKLFMTELGFEPATFAGMAAAYAAVVPLLEFPSSVLADRWSRRGTLVLAAVAALLSVVVGALSGSVATYIASAMLLGVFFAMQSGALEAAVYDTVVEETGDSTAFERFLGGLQVLNSVALVLSAVAGGWLAQTLTLRATYLLSIPFAAASVAALLAFREPRAHQAAGTGSLRAHLASTARTVRRGHGVLPVLAAMALCAMLLQVLFEFGPLWLVALDASPATFGPYTAAMVAALGIGGALAGRLALHRPAGLASALALLAGAALALALSARLLVVAAAQVVLAVLLVVLGIHLTRLLHDAVPSAVRASVTSGASTAAWLLFLPGAVLFGAVSSRSGFLAAGWIVVAVAGAACLGVLVGARIAGRQPHQPGPVSVRSRPARRRRSWSNAAAKSR